MRLAIGLALCLAAHAQTDLLKDVRIALRLNTGQVLIVGGEGQGFAFDSSMDRLAVADGYSPFQPVEKIFTPPQEYMKRLTFRRVTDWRRGDRWKLYTGATAPISVAIESPGFGYYCGGIGGYATALARFVNGPDANVALGLRAGAYLAAPGPGFAKVSESPLVPMEARFEPLTGIEAVLLELGRKTMGDENWKAQGSEEVRRMNREFLTGADLRFESRTQRWSLPGSKPLSLMEMVWSDSKGQPLFGADAIVEESATPAVLSFDPREGELMRVGETLTSGGWRRPQNGVFLNAWGIGGRRFVLVHTVGYEGFSVALKEIVPSKGLGSAGIEFGAGC